MQYQLMALEGAVELGAQQAPKRAVIAVVATKGEKMLQKEEACRLGAGWLTVACHQWCIRCGDGAEKARACKEVLSGALQLEVDLLQRVGAQWVSDVDSAEGGLGVG